MNIFGFLPSYNFKNTNNNIKPQTINTRYQFTTKPLTQDIISFKGDTDLDNDLTFEKISKKQKKESTSTKTRKLIEEFKNTKEVSGNFHVPREDVVAIYKYFGYKYKDCTGTHEKYAGPYGQSLTRRTGKYADVNEVKQLIEAIQRADDFNGELFICDGQPTQEKLDEWKNIIQRTPQNNNNKYAKEWKSNQESIKKEKEKEAQINKHQEIKKLREEITSFNLQEKEEEINKLQERFTSILDELKKDKADISQEEISLIKKLLNAKIFELNEIRIIENKLNKNEKLKEAEKNKLAKKLNESFDLSEIKEQIENLETKYLTQLSEKEDLIGKIITILNNFSDTQNQISQKLKEISLTLKTNKAEIIKANKEDVRNSLKQNIKKINENLAKLEKHANIDAKTKTPTQLRNKLEKTNEKIAEIKNQYNEIISSFNNNILPIILAPKNQIKEKIKTENKLINKTEETKELEEKNNTQKTLVTPINTFREKQTENIKNKLAKKLSPLPIPSIINTIKSIIDDKFEEDKFEQMLSQKITQTDFINDLVKETIESGDFSRIKNATRFAFLHSIYNLSEDKNNEIYSLNLKQINELYTAISNGQKSILIEIPNSTAINIKLTNSVDMQNVEKQINEFNTKLNDIDTNIQNEIINKITIYAKNNLTRNELKEAKAILLQEGSYYKLIIEDDIDDKLTKNLLKTFWKKYDIKTGKNITDKVLENYQIEEEKKQAQIMHQIKLKEIEEIDWTL